MLQVSLTLPSGRSERLSLPESSRVGDLKIQAQTLFQLGFLRVVAAGRLLDPEESLQAERSSGGRPPDSHCGAVEVTELSHGAIQSMVAATLRCKIS